MSNEYFLTLVTTPLISSVYGERLAKEACGRLRIPLVSPKTWWQCYGPDQIHLQNHENEHKTLAQDSIESSCISSRMLTRKSSLSSCCHTLRCDVCPAGNPRAKPLYSLAMLVRLIMSKSQKR
ncbi:hypothetical protein BJY01DRAFT_203183 [Aspergillus pseudoustus]|uniref:Uncharacterized protein n=1 Tax=Aspergillus pseudoustus TaxID=1810923 RepID=A0ABR4KWI6_9EURO